MTSNLTAALLSLGFKFPTLRADVLDTINTYLSNALYHSQGELDEDDTLGFAPPVLSFLGFLDSSARHINFWWSADPEHSSAPFISQVRRILSEDYLLNVETTFSSIRNSTDDDIKLWRNCISSYDASSRPLGAMLLQHEFYKFLSASTALLVVDTPVPQAAAILDAMMSTRGVPQANADKSAAVEPLADLAAEGVALIEDGTEYARTEWQQDLGFSVKAHALVSYACCAFLSGSMAESQLLNRWLATTIADGTQMASPDLATATLKILAIATKNDERAASNFISTLHKFIIEGGPNAATAKVAGTCLAYALRFQPQDATITTLNTLGHVLSSSNPGRALKAGQLQPFEMGGSTLSLVTNGGEDERLGVYASVIETVVEIVEGCADEKVCFCFISIVSYFDGDLCIDFNRRWFHWGRAFLCSDSTKSMLQSTRKSLVAWRSWQ